MRGIWIILVLDIHIADLAIVPNKGVCAKVAAPFFKIQNA